MTWRRHTFDLIIGAGVAFALILAFVPVSFWYSAEPEFVLDSRDGVSPSVIPERTIRRSFNGMWSVTVRRIAAQGAEMVCNTGEVHNRYEKDARLPDEVTMDWWTAGRCMDATNTAVDFTTLTPGFYRMTTCHAVELPFGITRSDCRQSNVFSVGVEINEQQQLQ